ncbi:hypothetical protein [Carnimonas bestiolae]|uniref:hypothetical protein n=1 Tax=Carnimonas bestiolae TaxID=3402172 RepID=UPI003F4AE1B0
MSETTHRLKGKRAASVMPAAARVLCVHSRVDAKAKGIVMTLLNSSASVTVPAFSGSIR